MSFRKEARELSQRIKTFLDSDEPYDTDEPISLLDDAMRMLHVVGCDHKFVDSKRCLKCGFDGFV